MSSFNLDCPCCGEVLHTIKGLCTDREEMREDKYCTECEIRYGLRCHGLVVLAKLTPTINSKQL